MSGFEIDRRSPSKQLAQDLRERLGDEAVLDGEQDRLLYSTDLLEAGATSALVVRPGSIEDLEIAVSLIGKSGFGIAPRGGGLTYVRGYTPSREGIVTIDMGRMNRILEVNERDMYITVEAGTTWRQIYEELKPRGLRLPFFGTFSGRGATVGGGLSNGALFFGTARYGTAAEIALGLEVVLMNGKRLQTGQRIVARAETPFFRTFGPDTTGLFTHDAGAFGIKAHATLRMIRTPAHTDYLSFGFKDRAQALAALSEIGRSELAEEAFVMDPAKTKAALSAPTSILKDSRTLAKVIGQERSLIGGLRSGVKLALAGRDFIEEGCYSLHMACSGRSQAAVAADMAAARAYLTKMGGSELPNSIPKVSRAEIFASLEAVVGAKGERWAAINAKTSHSDAPMLVESAEALIETYRADVDRLEIEVSRLLTVISNHAFSYEIVFAWKDKWLPMHHATYGAKLASTFDEPQDNPEARALVMKVRQELINLFAQQGAASSQIGRSYPYVEILRDQPRNLIEGIKRIVDADGLMNPGALGLTRL